MTKKAARTNWHKRALQHLAQYNQVLEDNKAIELDRRALLAKMEERGKVITTLCEETRVYRQRLSAASNLLQQTRPSPTVARTVAERIRGQYPTEAMALEQLATNLGLAIGECNRVGLL